MSPNDSKRAPRNRTMNLNVEEGRIYRERLLRLTNHSNLSDIINRTICQDVFEILDFLPANAFDLIVADPPYNLTKSFNELTFSKGSVLEYELWLDTWLPKLPRVLKPSGSIYVCGDWRSSAAIHRALDRNFIIRNRITWEREKGRGARTNWKNCSEDVWFATMSDEYTFNVDDVKLRRRVIAPYTDQDSVPKDWDETPAGRFRLTHPSNIWTDITVPFWSMPENTDHPTQKPEKLLAKIILASSNQGDVVLDPFLGQARRPSWPRNSAGDTSESRSMRYIAAWQRKGSIWLNRTSTSRVTRMAFSGNETLWLSRKWTGFGQYVSSGSKSLITDLTRPIRGRPSC